MNLLTIENISKGYTDKVLFREISMGIHAGERIGVLGVNGTGKSTLLRIIAGIETPDEGRVTTGKKVRIGYLPQTPVFDNNRSILENVIKGKQAEEEYRNLEGEASAMLLKLGISESSMTPEHLSGGQKKRAALVRTLLMPAEILVLDEPTNHLDNEMARWLEEYLSKYKGALIMVTHDRYFLDRVTNRIVELDRGSLYSYDANYSKFIELKALREDMAAAAERKNKSLYKIELEWMRRGARARSTKQKAHIQRFEELRDREVLKADGRVEMSSVSARLGRTTIELMGVSKAFGQRELFSDFSYIFLPGDRIGIIGPNGCGKSTLLKVITGVMEPDKGKTVIGQTVKLGYFSQENEYMDEKKKVIEYIRDTAEIIETAGGTITASQMLERFLFTGAMQYSLIGKLSGGEKRRLYLLKILMEAPNILILDEPTNDLDIATLNILEDYLEDFDGIVVSVSHDRYFLDKMAKRIFAFEENGRIGQYEGGYSDYEEKAVKEETKKQEEKIKNTGWKKRDTSIPKFSYLEKKEYETIDSEIESLEEKLKAVENSMQEAASDYGKLRGYMEEKEALQKALEDKMERWVYLNDLAERMMEAGGK